MYLRTWLMLEGVARRAWLAAGGDTPWAAAAREAQAAAWHAHVALAGDVAEDLD